MTDGTVLYEQLDLTPENVSLFSSFYKTNKHCYAEQLPPNENNKSRYNKIEGPNADFDEALISHLDGSRTLGVYTIILEEPSKDCCLHCTFDFDLGIEDRRGIEQITDSKARDEAFSQALLVLENKVRDFIIYLNSVGITNDMYLVSFSGSKGWHLDIFFDRPIPVKTVYNFASIIKTQAKLPKSLEVFPKQMASGGAYGSLIKLPLGVHRVTGKRGYFVDLFQDANKPPLSQFDYLKKTRKLSMDDIGELLDKINNIQLNVGTYSPEGEIKDLSKPPTCASISSMLSGCNALKRLINKAQKEHHLLHEERVCLMTFCIHFGESGAEKLHEIIANCSDYSKEETEKMIRHARDQKKYIPMSCARMQNIHICAKNCAEIIDRGGLSPIKLAYPKSKVDQRLELVEQVEQYQVIGKSISVPFKADSLVGGSYHVPKEVIFTCSEGCPARTGNKVICDFNNKSGETKYVVSSDGKDLISCIGIPEANNKRVLMGFARIPCVKPAFLKMTEKSHHHVQPIMISSADEVMRNMLFKSRFSIEPRTYYSYFNGHSINVSTDYIGIGRVHPHPKDQKTTFVFSKVERMLGNLDQFNPTPEQLEQLKAYKALDKQELVYSMADQVCGIRGRYREALTVMLTLFSPLQIEFNGRMLDRGWVETCFIGDSSQGKSKMPEHILKFLGTYNHVSGGNATTAGLIGGVDKYDNHQYISWGLLPISDKTIVFIDEMEKLQSNTLALSALREIRSTGRAMITKIKRGSKACRVRLIASANPAKGLSMDTYKRGCQAIMEIMETPDARRFDIFQFFFKDEVDASVILKEVTDVKLTVPQDVVRTGLLWSWTRSPAEIIFPPEVTREILKKAMVLMDKYYAAATTLPLISTDTHEKVARISASMAMFNMRSDDFVKVTVTIEDVENAYALLDGTYGSKSVALDEEAAECRRKVEVPADWLQYFSRVLARHQIPTTVSITEIIFHINQVNRIRAEELAMHLKLNRNDVIKVLQLLAADNMLDTEYTGGTYKPTAKLYKLARDLRDRKLSGITSNDIIFSGEVKPIEESIDDIFGRDSEVN